MKGGDKLKRIPIDLKFELMEYTNEGFSKGKCYVAYTDGNPNGSFISKEAYEKALPSIFGTPIVGEYLSNVKNEINADIKGNYAEHEKTIVRPSPIGFVSSDAKCYWEIQGDNQNYLVVEGIILWTKRYPEAKNVFDRRFNQSMEISIGDNGGYFDKKDELYHITDFSFEALTVLGTDCVRNSDGTVSYRGESDVEPCFGGSHFDTYSMKTEFRKEYEVMLKEFKNFNIQGGKNMSEELKVEPEEIEVIVEEPLVPEVAPLLEVEETPAPENVVEETEEIVETETTVEPEVEPIAVEETKTFTLSVSQISSAINEELEEMIVSTVDYWGEPCESQQYFMCDLITDDKLVIVCDCDCDECYGVPYAMTGDQVTLDFANKVAYTRGDWRPLVGGDDEETELADMGFSSMKSLFAKKTEAIVKKATDKATTDAKKVADDKKAEADKTTPVVDKSKKDFDKVNADLEKLQSEFATLIIDKETVETELNSYKLKEKEAKMAELFAKEEFACLVETQEFKDLKVKAVEEELESVETELFVMLGKFASKTFAKKKKEDSQIMSFGVYKYEAKEEKTEEKEPDYKTKWCKKETK